MDDLRRAVGICRLRFGDSRIRKPILIPILIYIMAFFGTILFRRRKGHNTLQRALQKRAQAFQTYALDYVQKPEFRVIPSKSKTEARTRAEDEIEHVGELIVYTHWPERYLWELPIGRANWYRTLARRETGLDIDFQNGDKPVVENEEDREFQESLPDEFRRKK